jgi:hypothetical protein
VVYVGRPKVGFYVGQINEPGDKITSKMYLILIHSHFQRQPFKRFYKISHSLFVRLAVSSILGVSSTR